MVPTEQNPAAPGPGLLPLAEADELEVAAAEVNSLRDPQPTWVTGSMSPAELADRVAEVENAEPDWGLDDFLDAYASVVARSDRLEAAFAQHLLDRLSVCVRRVSPRVERALEDARKGGLPGSDPAQLFVEAANALRESVEADPAMLAEYAQWLADTTPHLDVAGRLDLDLKPNPNIKPSPDEVRALTKLLKDDAPDARNEVGVTWLRLRTLARLLARADTDAACKDALVDLVGVLGAEEDPTFGHVVAEAMQSRTASDTPIVVMEAVHAELVRQRPTTSLSPSPTSGLMPEAGTSSLGVQDRHRRPTSGPDGSRAK